MPGTTSSGLPAVALPTTLALRGHLHPVSCQTLLWCPHHPPISQAGSGEGCWAPEKERGFRMGLPGGTALTSLSE